LQENNNIVNINTTKVSKLTKFSIYYLLNINKQICKLYSNNIKLFLVLINNEKNLYLFTNKIKNCEKKVNFY